MITYYSEKYIKERSYANVKFIIILNISILGVASILFYENDPGEWYIIFVLVTLVILNYGLVKTNKLNKQKQRMHKHSLECSDNFLTFSWPDSKSEILLKEIEKVIVKKTKNGVDNIRIITKTGREIDLKGYESMSELLEYIASHVEDKNIGYAKWYWFHDL